MKEYKLARLMKKNYATQIHKQYSAGVIGICLLFCAYHSNAQNSVGIGTNTPNQYTVLDVVAPNGNQGILLPRLTTTQRTDLGSTLSKSTGNNGLIIFDSTDKKFYYWKDTQWVEGLGTSTSAANGSIWRSGTIAAETNNVGKDGDFYLDTPTGNIYEKSGGVYKIILNVKGAAGKDGKDGADGKTILSGNTPPALNDGKEGDFYINTATSTIFGPKSGGNWGTGTSLKGPVTTYIAGNGITIDGSNKIISNVNNSTFGFNLGELQLKDKAVTAVKIAPGTITGQVLSTNGTTVEWKELPATTVATDGTTITGDGSSANRIGVKAGGITTSHIADGGIDQVLTTDNLGNPQWENKSALNSASAGAGLSSNANALDVNVDNTSIEIASNKIGVITDGITSTHIAPNTITNDEVSPAAAIAVSKIAGLGALATLSTISSSHIPNSTIEPTDIQPGTNGQVLSTNSSGNVQWINATTGTVTSVNGNGPISVIDNTTTPSISISQATSTIDGYLSKNDWSTFNGKQNTLTVNPGLSISGSTLSAQNTNALWNANQLQGKPIIALTPIAGQVLKYNNSGQWEAGNDNNAGVQSIGTPATTGSITFDVNSGLSMNLQAIKATAGGDVTGDLNTTKVVKLQGKSVADVATIGNGKVLKWNGSQWEPADDNSAIYTAGNGLSENTGTLNVNVDGSSLIINADILSVPTGGITTSHIQNNGIEEGDLAPNAVTSSKLQNNTVTTDKILNANVTPAKIAPSTIPNQVLTSDGTSVQWTALPAATVTADNFTIAGNGSATTPLSLKNDAVSTGKIANSTIINEDIATTAGIELSKLETISSGSILVGNAFNKAAALTMGKDATINSIGEVTVKGLQGTSVSATLPTTNGQILKYDGTQWAPGVDNDNQNLSLAGNTLSITNGGAGVTIDPNSTNEIQTLTRSGNDLTISGTGGNTVSLSATAPTSNGQVLKWNGTQWEAGTDNGAIYTAVTGSGISINGSNQIQNTGDTDATNDITNTTTAGGELSGTFSTLTINNNAVTTGKILNDNVTAAKINADVAGNGLGKNGTDGSLEVKVATAGGLEINTDQLQLANVGIAGTYGSTTQVGVITTDAKGRITSVTPTTIVASGDVTGNINATTVTKLQGKPIDVATGLLNNTTDIDKVLTWDGSKWIAAPVSSTGSTTTSVKYYSIDPTDFIGTGKEGNKVYFYGDNASFVATDDKSDSGVGAPIHLPHGSTISEVTFYYHDSDNSDNITFELFKKRLQNTTQLQIGSTNASIGNGGDASHTLILGAEVVDNSAYTYRVIIDMNKFPHDSDVTKIRHRIYSVVIKYTETVGGDTPNGQRMGGRINTGTQPALANRQIGMLWLDSNNQAIKQWNGTSWITVLNVEDDS